MYCRKCGKEIHDEAVICVHCGCDTMGERTAEDKYCKICGKEITEDDMICMGCGCKLSYNIDWGEKKHAEQSSQQVPQSYNRDEQGEDKTGVGVALGLFLGIIGLVIGMLMYPSGSYESKTFLKGWLWTIVTCVILGIVIGIIVAAGVASRSFRY